MDEFFARVSKAGRVVCGRQHADGGFYCDEPVAATITRVHEPPRYPERGLLALPGWRMDRKGIWRRTTSVEDRRARGLTSTNRKGTAISELPALASCPKCGALQWLDGEHLGVRTRSTSPAQPGGRWLTRELPPPARKLAGRLAPKEQAR